MAARRRTTTSRRHAHRAGGQRHRDHHREQLGRQPDRERDGEQEGLRPGLAGYEVHGQHEQHQAERESHEQQAEASRADLEGVRGGGLAQAAGDPAHLGPAAGAAHQDAGRAADDRAAHEDRVARGAELSLVATQLHRVFLDRVGLAREVGLLDEEVARLQHPAVGGDQVARGEEHDVPLHDLRDRHVDLATIAHHPRVHGHRGAQLLGNPGGSDLLHEVDRDRRDHEPDHDERACEFSRGGVDDAGTEQDQDQRVAEVCEVLEPECSHRPAREPVRPGACQAEAGILRSEP